MVSSTTKNRNLGLQYVERVVDRLGDRVSLWVTINEPMVFTTGKYLGQFMPPAIHSPQTASEVTRNLIKSHFLARRTDSVSDLDWAVHPNGLSRILKRLDQYKLTTTHKKEPLRVRLDCIATSFLPIVVSFQITIFYG